MQAVRDGCTIATQTMGKMSTLSSQLADFADSLKSSVAAKGRWSRQQAGGACSVRFNCTCAMESCGWGCRTVQTLV